MSYPPHQPGPGGWGQQPAGNTSPQGHPDPSGMPQQQPNWYGNQHTGWGQQPGQQAPGQGQDIPSPAPPDWQGAFGSWVQEPGGFEAVEPTTTKKSKLPWILGGLGTVVVAGGVTGGVLWYVNSGSGDARPIAQEVVNKVNAHDFAGLEAHLCSANKAQLDRQLNQIKPAKFNIQLGNITVNGDQATARLSGTYSMNGASQPVNQTMLLTVEGGEWKLCQISQ